MAYRHVPWRSPVHGILANADVLNKLLDWRECDPRFMRTFKREDLKMQRQFTIEARVDYADNEKTEEVKKTIAQLARHLFATLNLLADNGVTPQIAIWSDDFFYGHQELNLLDDVIEQGKMELEDQGVSREEETISSELADAVRK